MKDFIFIHKDQKHEPIIIPENGITQELVCKLAEHLCADDIIYLNGHYYTHIQLSEFLNDMASLPYIKLDVLYSQFQEELSKCLIQQIKNLQIGAEFIQGKRL